MNARHKLNSAVVQGTLIIAGLLGWLFRSWWVFVIALAVMIVSAMHSGDIRSQPTRHRTNRRRK